MSNELLPVDRFLHTLTIVNREGRHLAYSWQRLSMVEVSAEWVAELEARPEQAEMLEAFVSRFGRMQDTIGEKLLPRWLAALAESARSQIEVLQRAERLGVLESVDDWLAARQLRNRLVHEYMTDAGRFAQDLNRALAACRMLFDCYNRVYRYAAETMQLPSERPSPLELPRANGG